MRDICPDCGKPLVLTDMVDMAWLCSRATVERHGMGGKMFMCRHCWNEAVGPGGWIQLRIDTDLLDNTVGNA
jgi:NMD protein affecting ribosome stability and mRNA decay